MADDPDKKSFRPPPSYRQIGPNAGTDTANETINNAQALVGGFLHAQRQHVAASNLAYHRSSFSSPDIDVYYTNQNGAEKIEYDTHPQEAAIAEAIEDQEEEVGIPDIEPPVVDYTQPKQPDAATSKACLMVLFGTDGIAAFSMDGLGPTAVGDNLFLGTSSGSNWGSKIMPIGQYFLGDTGWILTPTDFVGGSSSTKMRLSTTKLTDQVATQATTGAVPIASGGEPLFTVGGAFSIDAKTKAITQVGTMAMDGAVVVQPTAIDTDGTSYFFPELIGADIVIQMDGASTFSGYGHSSSFDAQVATQVQGLQKSIPNPLITTVSYVDTSTVYYPSEGNQQIESVDATGECMIVTYGTFVHLAWQNGSSYYGKGPFGQVPTPQNVKISQSVRTYEVYDISQNQTTLQSTPASGSVEDYSNVFPLQTYVYDPSKSNDTMTVGFPNISATCTQAQPLTLVQNKDGEGLIGSTFGVQGLSYTGGGSTVSNRVVQVGFSNNYEATYPAFTGSTADDAKDFYGICQGVASAVPNLIASRTIEMIEFILDNDPPASIKAQWATAEDSPFPSDCIVGFVTVDGVQSSGASSYNHPFSHGNIEADLHRYTQVGAFGRMLTYSYTQGAYSSSTTTTTPKPYMNVHAFPPAFDKVGDVAKPYFNSFETNQEEQLICTTYTPYGTYPQNPGVTEPFQYWLHLSNAKHVIQGYLISGVPYAFVDGSTASSWLDTLASACKTQKSQIKGIFMDIQLDEVQGLTGVQSAVYSTTTSSEPAPPASNFE